MMSCIKRFNVVMGKCSLRNEIFMSAMSVLVMYVILQKCCTLKFLKSFEVCDVVVLRYCMLFQSCGVTVKLFVEKLVVFVTLK